MSELLERHEEYELREQWVAEQYWPAGGAAENLRAILIKSGMCGGDKKELKMIWQMLEGSYEPETEAPKKQKEEILKQQLKSMTTKK